MLNLLFFTYKYNHRYESKRRIELRFILSYTVNPDFVRENKENIAVFLQDFKQLD